MEQYIQSVALVLLTSVLGLVLAQKGKEFTLLLTLGACCLLGLVAMQYLEPVLNFAERFKTLTGMDHELLEVLLKVVGISLVAELASMICTATLIRSPSYAPARCTAGERGVRA